MFKSKQDTSVLLQLSIIITLFLVTCSFYFLRSPSPPDLVIPFYDQPDFEQIDIPSTKQPDTPIKPPKPHHDIGDVKILRDEIEDIKEFKTESRKIESPIKMPEEPEIVHLVPELLSSPPKLIYREQIIYPFIAKHNGIEGTVHVQFILSKRGVPEHLQIIKSSNDLLNEAALKAIEKYRYKPGFQDLLPVRVKMIIPVQFRLH